MVSTLILWSGCS